MIGTMNFTGELWRSITPIYGAIQKHPFVRGLTDGTLPLEAFRFYAVQDALYLRDFARALAMAGARAPRDEWIIMFNEHAAGALRVERALHESFFGEWGLTPGQVMATPLAPTNLAYTSYLLAVAHGAPFHEGLAAVLPCYWI
jgi:thiaminase (transcriptional activator TenA)